MRFKFLEWDAARLEIHAKALSSGGEESQSFRLRTHSQQKNLLLDKKAKHILMRSLLYQDELL